MNQLALHPAALPRAIDDGFNHAQIRYGILDRRRNWRVVQDRFGEGIGLQRVLVRHWQRDLVARLARPISRPKPNTARLVWRRIELNPDLHLPRSPPDQHTLVSRQRR